MTRHRKIATALLASTALGGGPVPHPDDPPSKDAPVEDRLDLDRDAGIAPGPASIELIATLRREIRAFDAGDRTIAAEVGRALRERAVLLLEARGGEAEIAALAGLRLAIARRAVDRFATTTIAEISDLGSRRLAEWRTMLLERFANRSLEDLREAVAGRRGLDGPLARSITPLFEAMTVGTSHVAGNHWPAPPGPTGEAMEVETGSETRAETSTIWPVVASQPELVVAFESWRARAERAETSARSIDATAAALETIVAAEDLPGPLRTRLRAVAIARLGDPQSEGESTDAKSATHAGTRWLLAAADLLEAIEAASQRGDRSRRARSMLVERILQPLAMLDAEVGIDDATEAMTQAAATLDVATLASKVADRPIRRELRATRTTLRRRAVEAESRWIAGFEERLRAGDLDRAATRATGLAHVEDLERLAGLSLLVDRVAGLEPRATVAAASRAREFAAPLVEPLKRSAAAARIDALLGTSPLRPTPIEVDDPPIGDADADAVRRRLDTRRREWIAAWLAGDPASTAAIAAEVETLRDLLAISTQVVAVQSAAAEGSLGRRVAPWGAWWIRPETIDAAIGTLGARAALATTAWSRGDLAAARRSLAAIVEAVPLAAFAIEVDDAIGDRLGSLAQGALGAIECLALPPDGDSWFPRPRRQLARLSLLAFERHAALAAGREADADRLRLKIVEGLATASPRGHRRSP